jgi:hypothetical protein
MGYGTTAGGNYSTAMGSGAGTTGEASTAMGYGTSAGGDYSTAMGRLTIASGEASLAMGDGTTASGDYSTAMGYSNFATAIASAAFGSGSTASGDYSTAMGNTSTASGWASTAMGYSTASQTYATAMGYSTASGTHSTAMGNATASGNYSTAMGFGTTASGYASTAMGKGTAASGDYSTAMGSGTTAYGQYSTAMGNSTLATGVSSTAMGALVTAGSSGYNMALGCGVDYSNHLVNNTAFSLMVGFNSTVPTFFVGPSSGAGTTGQVGIATSDPDPETKLHIRADSDDFGVLVDAGVYGSEIGLHAANSQYCGLVKNAYYDGGWKRFNDSHGAFLQEINPTGHVRFRTAASGSGTIAWNECLALTSDGDVGIRTTNPGYTLQIGIQGDGTDAIANDWISWTKKGYMKDIEAFDSSDYADVLSKVDDMDVVRYRFVNDEHGVERIGVTAEDSPKEILDRYGEGVSLGKYTSFLLAAIKAQQAQIADQKERIEKLEAQISRLH